jgi:glutamate--cysteine ligase
MPDTTMNDIFTQRLAVLMGAAPQRSALARGGLRGIEKESLRITRDGQLALTPHPVALGSALTHESLTTDYSEALLELVTPAESDAAITLARLDELHRFACTALAHQGEMLWNASMPGLLPDTDEGIPIARYGTSNSGRLRHTYRIGLALRYGRTMQCIAGIHYNYSLDENVWRILRAAEQSSASRQDDQSERYLALIRNFRRISWLLMYLFGASPALDVRFLRGHAHTLDPFDTLDMHTLYHPYATSLRMSDLGYSNNTGQSALHADYDTLRGYMQTLAQAVSEPYPPYEAMGTHHNGEWVQINTNVLQIENEFYTTIRPKRVTQPGERPLHALAAHGVQYVEVRCMDIDPFEPTGITLQTARFLDAFLLACALKDSPPLPPSASAEAQRNFGLITMEGRRPQLELMRKGQRILMRDWAAQIMLDIDQTAAALDAAQGGDEHAQAVAAQRAKLADATLTPSARVLQAMRENQQGWLEFGLAQSAKHAADFLARPLDAEATRHFEALARASLEEQARRECSDTESFEDFVAAYRAYVWNNFNV